MSVQSVQIELSSYMAEIGRRARSAAQVMALAGAADKNRALEAIARRLSAQREALMAANANDVERARKGGLDSAMIDRLVLDDRRIEAMAEGLGQIAALPDPVGQIDALHYRPSGIQVGRMRVPLGVIGIIYESRPNVTADAAALCLKAGNAAVLRGGSEALDSNRAIAECVRWGLAEADLPAQSVQVIDTADRAAVTHLITMSEFVDVIVPRGGKGLIERVGREATVPVIKHLDGVCHVYIDDDADADKAVAVAFNAKTQRYGTCNTMETLLLARSVAPTLLPRLARLFLDAGVELRGCEQTRALVAEAKPAGAEDWSAEYLAPILAIRVVDGLEEAIAHIQRYGSGHTDCIVTQDWSKARHFVRAVDSSSVMVNASTRFADGFEYGLGAEIGISTDKLHARGPVGLEGLTSQKWVVYGDGHVRGE